MSRRSAGHKGATGITSRLRNRKVMAIIAGCAAVVLALVLILTTLAAPDENEVPGNVLAIVNDEEITEADVASMQRLVFQWDGVVVEADEVLEQLIDQRLLFREAERRDHVPDLPEVELELLARLSASQIPLEQLHLMLQEAGLSYDEFLEHRRWQIAITTLLDDEIGQLEVTEEEIIQAYEEYKATHLERYPGKEPPPLERIRSLIVAMAKDTKRQDAVSLFVNELRGDAEIVYKQTGE